MAMSWMLRMKVWRRCLVKQATPAFKERVAPQQLAVGISGGCEIKILGSNLELERQLKQQADYAHVAIDLKNAHTLSVGMSPSRPWTPWPRSPPS